MKPEWVGIMKKNKRLKMKISQTFTHYGIVFFLLFIVLLPAWNLLKFYVTNTYTSVLTVEELVKFSLPFLLLAVVFAFIQYNRLNFKEISVTFTDEQFDEAVKRTIEELEWRIEENSKYFFRAVRPWNWTGSWGEMVTIIKDKDKLLINSICDPGHISSVVSYGWNRKNIETFLRNLTDVLSDKPAEVNIEKVTNEGSIKRMVNKKDRR